MPVLNAWGIILVCIGLGVILGGGGVPPYGSRRGYALFTEAEDLKKSGNDLSIDHQSARNTFYAYIIGGLISGAGGILLLISILSK